MTPEEVPGAKFQVRNFFSDDLFIPWLTSQFRIPDSVWGALGRNTPAAAANGASEEAREAKDPEIRKLKSWLQIENIPRRSNLSYEEFVREYEVSLGCKSGGGGGRMLSFIPRLGCFFPSSVPTNLSSSLMGFRIGQLSQRGIGLRNPWCRIMAMCPSRAVGIR